MGMHYGTPIRDDILAAETTARERHSHFYEPPGWLYRVEAVCYSACSLTESGWEDYYVTAPVLEVFAFPVWCYTEHGATLAAIWSGARRRWVDLRPGAKQWASRTVAEAVAQLAERRRRQLYILAKQMSRAERELQLCRSTLAFAHPQETPT